MTRRFAILLILFSSFPFPARATSVADLKDLPIEIQDLLNSVQQVKATLDQLIVLMDEYDHWLEQSKKLTRNGFRLRDLTPFLFQNAIGTFYNGPSGLGDLAAAIDSGGNPGAVTDALLNLFPPVDPIDEWQTGQFSISGEVVERVKTLQKAAALNYTGMTEAFANVGQARQNWFENKDVYDTTMDLFENPVHGEQEALDLITVQMGQLVDLSIQETALLNGYASALAGAANQRLAQEKEQLDTVRRSLQVLTDMIRHTPEVRDVLRL
ncbi:MAG: hypothetical protein QNK37_35235 [Acidobacteriota bacterium]|nr:hypothetical protein [Acidobacteriota bacterium]